MEEPISEEERQQRAKATSTILFCIAEGLAEGKWREFKFKVRQHRTERRDAITNRVRIAGRAKLEITFSMDIYEEEFKRDVERRKAAIAEALQSEVDRSAEVRLLGNRPDRVILDDSLNDDARGQSIIESMKNDTVVFRCARGKEEDCGDPECPKHGFGDNNQ